MAVTFSFRARIVSRSISFRACAAFCVRCNASNSSASSASTIAFDSLVAPSLSPDSRRAVAISYLCRY
ncbi:hypothetical protein Plhal304r1_c041g0120321 [Plasmopara halstedii]